jgi:hypothetical protein
MNSIKKVPADELYYNLSRLNETAKAVAFAKTPADAEYFTLKYLRPQIATIEALLNNARQNRQASQN